MKIILTKENVGYSAHIPDFFLTTQGETFDELMTNIEEAISLYYEEENTHAQQLISSSFYLEFSNFHASELSTNTKHS